MTDTGADGINAASIAAYLDTLLENASTPDYPGALNGLQCDNRMPIESIAAAVDFSLRTIEGTIERGANLLLVHHGMFWGGARPLRGVTYERMRLLIDHDIAVYASHLPLDRHPTLGNNTLLARELGLEPSGTFAMFKGMPIGVSGTSDVPTAELVGRATSFAALHGGVARATDDDADPRGRTRRWAICTGGGASSETLAEAVAAGIDTLIVGEGPHHTAVEAADQGIVVIYAGHYATETLGVRALAEHTAARFGVDWTFIDAPTGL